MSIKEKINVDVVDISQAPLRAEHIVSKDLFWRTCGKECPAELVHTNFDEESDGEILEDQYRVKCAILNAFLAGDVKEARDRISIVREKFKNDSYFVCGCTPIRVFEHVEKQIRGK